MSFNVNPSLPPSMINEDITHGFDTDMAGPVQDSGLFFNQAFTADTLDEFLLSSPRPSPALANPQKMELDTSGVGNGQAVTSSPESSTQDSSSEGSRRHKRKSSSTSSRSGVSGLDITMKDIGKSNPNSLPAGERSTFDFSAPITQKLETIDFSNAAMSSHFDFDSAASSPSPNMAPNNVPGSGPRYIAIPYRESTGSAASFLPRSRSSTAARDSSPLSTVMASDFQPVTLQQSRDSPAYTHDAYIDNPMINSIQNLPYSSTLRQRQRPSSTELQTAFARQPPFYSGLRGSRGSVLSPYLTIQPTPPKSRVETQIPIKMTLFPMPHGVTKLHLLPHTISKPKLLVKPPPIKAPDTLELYTTLVCTSAMQDPVKMQRAFARAAAQTYEATEEKRRSSAGDANAPADDVDHPSNGGEVRICSGCITRERKRAARKKSKKPEEEELWQKDEAKRVIVFNTTEIKDWQTPNSESDGHNEHASGFRGPPTSELPEGAMQVEMPMRIACYCRHQNEKIGFQVIFTLKDNQDRLVAQAITNPIVITDDHKTHAPPTVPPPGMMFANPTQISSGDGMFSREPLASFGNALYRNAHSATDLQALQRNFNPQRAVANFSLFAISQSVSQVSSTTLTPCTLSRQASPTVPSGPMSKKRKASGTGKLPDNLIMTRIQHGHQAPTQGRIPVAASYPISPPGASPFSTTFPSQLDRPIGQLAQQPRSSHFHTDPPTPDSGINGFFSQANRSQSLENLSAVQQRFSASPSAHGSRAPSPTSSHHNLNAGLSSGFINPAFAQTPNMLTGRPPTIHKMVPSEGPKAGGIEVTCLGSGFYQGLEVMFGDAPATTTTYWGETSLVCLLPPAMCAGKVPVMFKHQYQTMLQGSLFSAPPLPKQQIFFKYIDEDEQDLLRQAMVIINQKFNNRLEDAGDIARNIVQQHTDSGSWTSFGPSGNQQRSFSRNMDAENTVLKCLDVIDLNDSPFPAHLDLPRQNGQSLLHLAASLGFSRLAAALLARTANPDLLDRNGMSPMHMAALNGHAQIVRRLRFAGGNPLLRSLRGYTPADMSTCRCVLEVIEALPHIRSLSAGDCSSRSRTSSVESRVSVLAPKSATPSFSMDDDSFEESDVTSEDEGSQGIIQEISARRWAQSRRNSGAAGQSLAASVSEAPAYMFPAAAMTAWRDNLVTQIQHFQQSVHWTFPHLQMPTLPPIPNLPDYQAPAMVRRFSSMVPQRAARPTSPSSTDIKDNDTRWWDFLTGSQSPPAYDEIYPLKTYGGLDAKRESTVSTMIDAIADDNVAPRYDTAQLKTVNIGKHALTPQQEEDLRIAYAQKLKRLRSDRNLFFVWIPLLVLVLVMMLKDRIPQFFGVAVKAIAFIRGQYEIG